MEMDLAALFRPQHRRLIKLVTPTLGEQELLLDSFSGVEELSKLFTFELSILCRDARLELKSLMGQPAQLQIELADGGVRYIDGMISRFSLEGSDGGLARYSATLSPWLWMLSQRQDSRIFQEQTVEDIIRAVFAVYGALPSFDFQLFKPLKVRSYITQYFESDLDFVLRLLEGEGLFFFFEHNAKGHRLVVMDRSQQLVSLPEQPQIRYHSASVTETADAITQWRANRQLQSGSMWIQTFDYKQTTNPLPVSMRSLNDQGQVATYEIYDYTVPCSHRTGRDGEDVLRHRIETHEMMGKGFSGESNCRAMTPGFTFELTQHFDFLRVTLEDRTFLLLKVEHSGRNNYLSDKAADYRNSFACIRAKIPFRPPLTVPRPTIAGPLTAKVVGPEGEEVFTDELARVKVRFHWQRTEAPSELVTRQDRQDTSWLRVAMPSAGAGFGHQFLPRIDQEVLVHFIAGDIDRPVISAVLFNAANVPPHFSGARELPGNKRLSGIKSKEHLGEGYSELLFDDSPGQVRARLATTHHASALNLGKLTTPRKNGNAELRGEGAELRTDAAIALRAAQGMLLTTYAREGAKGAQLDRDELLKLLTECGELFKSLGQTAAARGSQQVDLQGIEALRQSLDQWPAPESKSQGEPVLAFAAEAGIASATPRSQVHYAGENHDTTAQDHLQMTSGGATRVNAGKGIGLFAQEDGIRAIANRGKVLVQAQEDDIALNAEKNVQVSATEGEVLITAPTIRLVADDGSYIKIGGGIEIGTSGKAIVHASEHDWVGAKTDSALAPAFNRDSADQRATFHYPGHSDESPRVAGGRAYQIKLDDGSVMQGLTDAIGLTEGVVRDAMQRTQIEAMRNIEREPTAGGMAALSSAQDGWFDEQFHVVAEGNEVPLANHPYRVTDSDGQVWDGITNAEGLTDRFYTRSKVKLSLEILPSNQGRVIK